MDFTNLFASKIETASQTIGAINCFSEFVSSKFNDLANFMSGFGTYASVYVNEANDTLTQKLVVASVDDYDYAVENPEADVDVKVSDGDSDDTYISIKGRDLTDAFDEQLSNLRCQEQFIQYCLNVSSTSVSDFMTRVKTIAPALSGAIIDKFSRLIEISGSPLECLKNFFSQYKDDSVIYEDQYIELTDPSQYTGNVWASAFTIIADTIAGFFEGAWRGIQDLGGFFQRVLDGIIKLGQWIVSHAFRDLTTVYDKACDASIGIMDLPVFQFYGTQSEVSNFIDMLHWANYNVSYSWDAYNHVFSQYPLRDILYSSVLNLTRDTFDGVQYNSVTEVVIPSSPCDLSIRIGKTSNDRICLSGYIVTDYGSWSQFTDYENNDRVFNSIKNGLRFLSSVIPIIAGKQNVDDTSIRWNETTEELIMYNHHDDTQLVELLKHPSTEFRTVSNTTLVRIIGACFVYVCLMSKGFVTAQGIDCTDTVIASYLFNGTQNTYTLTSSELDFINPLNTTDIDVNTFGKNAFKPYSKRNQLPVSIHYQTTDEQAKEILSAVLKIIVAVVAVVATIKFIKWSKKRKKDTLLAHADVDRLSWDVAANPTPANLEKFNKAYRKSKKMDFVNGILGVGSSSDNATSSLLGSMANILGSSKNESTTAVNNISSVDTKVVNLSGDISAVKSLIDGH